MRRSSAKVSLLTKSLIAFVVCASSSNARAEPTRVLGLELHLDRVQTWTSTSGQDYVGWPAEDAEVMLEFFEKRLPLLLEIERNWQSLSEMQKRQVELLQELRVLEQQRADAALRLAETWKRAATENDPSVLETVLTAVKWVGVGVAGGIVLMETIQK